MSTFTDRLRELKEQVSRLMREHQQLQQRYTEKEQEAREQHQKLRVLEARVHELERENDVLRKAERAVAGPADPGSKERIDELVAEIDRCLELLRPAER